MKYDYLVFIGRFQPFHFGHAEVIKKALSLSKKVIVLAGSANAARSLRNPFTLDERYTMIKKVFPEVIVRGIDDHTYNDSAWIKQVNEVVKDVILRGNGTFNPNGLKDYKIGLIGCAKDHTSYYLKLFPNWESESVEFVDPINATAIRKMIFEENMQEFQLNSIMHRDTVHWIMHEYAHSINFDRMKYMHEYIIDYHKQWGPGPHLTADALVQVGGYILLVTRGAEYGQGLLAMPGGFKHMNENFLDAALRELREETRLKVPEPVLKGSIVNQFLADHPNRSERGCIVSMVQHIVLENDTTLPKVKGSDDAAKAEWWNLADIEPQMFFEDHYHIIKKLTGI